jgi:hypothetical protein
MQLPEKYKENYEGFARNVEFLLVSIYQPKFIYPNIY